LCAYREKFLAKRNAAGSWEIRRRWVCDFQNLKIEIWGIQGR
jgi:hypothetical protein